jgi:hypothetical protein
LVKALIVADGDAAFGTVTVMVNVQLFASRIVAVYVPASNPVAVFPFCTGVVLHVTVYPGVPPEGFTVALPFAALHVD